MKRLPHILFLTLLVGLTVLSPEAPAQGNNATVTERARRQLEKTDELIERARAIVHSSGAPAASLALEAAVDYQDQAWRSFRNQYPRLAESLTLKAREFATKAIAAGRISEQNESAALRRLEKAEELIERAREYLSNAQGSEFEVLFRTSRDNLDRAWEFYRQNQFRPAVLLIDQVEKALEKLADMANRQEHLEGQYERHLDAVHAYIERCRETVSECASESAKRLLDEAVRTWELARELAGKSRFDGAIKTLQTARELAADAGDQCRDGQSLQNRYERLRHEADLLADQVAPTDDRGRQLIELTNEQLGLARDNLGRSTEAAVAALRAADMTLDQLRQHLRMPGF